MIVWTSERIELLKKLWAEGLSASHIAIRIGGVTRNAVIGKVHRLGLSGRVTTSRLRKARSVGQAKALLASQSQLQFVFAVATASGQSSALAIALGDGCIPAKPVLVETPVRLAPVLAVVPAVEAVEVEDEPELAAPTHNGVSLLDLKESMCRFPIGDPTEPGFHFCGARRADGLPYCEKHSRIAFQPVQRRVAATRQAVATIKKAASG